MTRTTSRTFCLTRAERTRWNTYQLSSTTHSAVYRLAATFIYCISESGGFLSVSVVNFSETSGYVSWSKSTFSRNISSEIPYVLQNFFHYSKKSWMVCYNIFNIIWPHLKRKGMTWIFTTFVTWNLWIACVRLPLPSLHRYRYRNV
jgi:hypothetical protein